MNAIVTDSVITCPACGWAQPETMPEDACQVVYHCVRCDALLRPLAGDCCVYCSYGSTPCPPIQRERMPGT
ncbi:MAG TPA: GDCCVxC domain-containing (seleno)protein [Thermomicrobiales bacterium]|nr:GDCCVxC domain-containing (seleno)protein [Thermomicrobiales bacterium]